MCAVETRTHNTPSNNFQNVSNHRGKGKIKWRKLNVQQMPSGRANSAAAAAKLAPAAARSATQAYTWRMRFEDEPGTNPEELVAAAHAACYSMALAAGLGKAGFIPDFLTPHPRNLGYGTGGCRLDDYPHPAGGQGKVPNIDEAAFQQHAETAAKNNCPISRLLSRD